MNAKEFLEQSAKILDTRADEYDKCIDGTREERSMGKTVEAFNTITGHNLTESEGWLLMLLLKQVRQWGSPGYHADSALDGVSYAALLAEALERGDVGLPANGFSGIKTGTLMDAQTQVPNNLDAQTQVPNNSMHDQLYEKD